jgi:RNA-directed DNA polymerase
MTLTRFLSINSSTNFCNVNNNGNSNNNNSSNANGVVPDSSTNVQHETCENHLLEKEIETCGENPKYSHDVCCQEIAKSDFTHDFDMVTDPYSLLLSYYKCRKGVTWKNSVQRYEQHLLRNILDTSRKLKRGEIVTKGFKEFDINERGKQRHIKSVHISERVVQKSLCDNVLVPILTKPLAYDNGASQKGKGTFFTRKRLKVHLMRHFRECGNEGYIVLMDCKKYFDSISHDLLYNMLQGVLDERSMALAKQYIDAFGSKGLGLGSQTSQIASVYFPYQIDDYAKRTLRLKHYARYMDDSYCIVGTKKEANDVLDHMIRKYWEFGLELNVKKTQVVKLSRGFTFLKCKYRIDSSTGRITMKPDKSGMIRMCRKMRKFKKNQIPQDQVENAYKTWRGYWKKLGGNPRKTDFLYEALFGGVA